MALPTGWVRGPLKEQQWSTLLAARALDTTSYMIAAGECGNRNIGQSRIIDPLGVTIAAAADRPALIVAEIFRERIDQVREQLPLAATTICATAIIMMFFTQSLIHLVTDCYCVRASKDR